MRSLTKAGRKSVIHVVLTVELPALAVADAGLVRKCANKISAADEINNAVLPKTDREH